MSEIRDRILATINRALELDGLPESMTGEHLVDELGMTSVDALEVLIWIENEFGITVADEDLNQDLVDSLDVLERYVVSRLGEADPVRR